MSTVLLTLPAALREELQAPWGEVFEDAGVLLEAAGEPVVAVGDVVTYHLEAAGRLPSVSVVDEATERGALAEPVASALAARPPDVTVENPPATLTRELLVALREALAAEAPVRILVEGEEDLAALPAVVVAPTGASVVYGQPGAGMVLVEVTAGSRARARAFLRRMDGDADAALACLGDAPG